jgi:hypothetical protein
MENLRQDCISTWSRFCGCRHVGDCYQDSRMLRHVTAHVTGMQQARIPAGAARAGGGVSISAAGGVCRSAYGAMLPRAAGGLIFYVHIELCSSTRLSVRRYSRSV